ncbi:MAG: hypothetical protein LBS74_03025 [Oscillospiraceae bacterium]|nr:hypothetical protein [Oscillospiraceae bacterium]
MDNSNKIILDLCGGSGSWSLPYKKSGYSVHVITLPDFDIKRTTFNSDYVNFYNDIGCGRLAVPLSNIYGILAAPPCTEFSQAINGRRERNIEEGWRIVKACLEIIWHCQIKGNLKFWALENPQGNASGFSLQRLLGKPHYVFEQWQFGHEGIKATNIWGYFKGPVPTAKERPEMKKAKNGALKSWGNVSKMKHDPEMQQFVDYVFSFPDQASRCAAQRAITPTGFAQAFYKANI